MNMAKVITSKQILNRFMEDRFWTSTANTVIELHKILPLDLQLFCVLIAEEQRYQRMVTAPSIRQIKQQCVLYHIPGPRRVGCHKTRKSEFTHAQEGPIQSTVAKLSALSVFFPLSNPLLLLPTRLHIWHPQKAIERATMPELPGLSGNLCAIVLLSTGPVEKRNSL